MIVLIPCMFLLLGFIRETPVHVAKVNLKLSNNEIAITFLALSNGEATLIQHAEAGNVLINTGGPGTKDELKQLFNMYNITDLRSIVITNDRPEYKHNLEWIAKNYKVDEVFVGNKAPSYVEKLDVPKITFINKGDHLELLPHLMIHILHVQRPHYEIDMSLKYGDNRVLYMTTANSTIEKAIAKKELKDVNVNILKVADFASNIGTSQLLLDSIDPQVAIIFKKKGTLPSKDVLERLNDMWTDIYQTNRYGNVSIKFSPSQYDIITIH